MTWDGAYNLSDLGGIALRSGDELTVPGRVFRSGAPEFLTDRGWNDAKADGLTTIVDLRNESERGRRGQHPEVDPASTDGIDVISAPTEVPDDAEFMRVCGPWLDNPRSYADNLGFYPDKFAAVFRAIAHADGAVLVHCAGGRDRTGMVSAMLLSLAGVSPEAIADDYESAFRRANDHVARLPDAREHLVTPEQLDARIAERRVAMIEWIDGFDVEGYLAEAGLTGAELTRLKSLLRANRPQ